MRSARPLLIAHRGASGRWAEHTRAAFLQALEEGADGVECDLRLTADHHLVCWHDPTVDRTSDGRGPVHEHTLDQLRALDVWSWKGPVPPSALGGDRDQLMTLDDLLDVLRDAGRPLRLALELKHPAPYVFDAEVRTLDVLRRRGWDPTTGLLGQVHVSLMSFHPGSLEALRTTEPTLDPGLLMPLLDSVRASTAVVRLARFTQASPRKIATVRRLAVQARAMVDDGEVGAVGPSVAFLRAHPAVVRSWLAGGRLVRVWTVDTADDLALCLEAGVPEVTTDVPARLGELVDTLVDPR
jgi:glycerophosphoryl diester phosphodiesterase